jgi:hypothetical protein
MPANYIKRLFFFQELVPYKNKFKQDYSIKILIIYLYKNLFLYILLISNIIMPLKYMFPKISKTVSQDIVLNTTYL